MLDWWKSLTRKQQVAMIVAVIGAIGGISVALNIDINTGDTITQTTGNGDAIIHRGNGNINTGDTYHTHVGITLEQHEQRLKQREAEIRAELEQAHAEDRQLLEAELNDIQQALQDTKASHKALVADLQERIARLEAQRGEWPGTFLYQAIEALQKGDIKAADLLFEQTTQSAENWAVEGYFQRGKIAEDDYRYADAILFYENSVRLQTDNSEGWRLLGNMYYRIGELVQAKKAYETLLSVAGTNQVILAKAYNNLGNVYRTRSDLDKAVEFHEKALAIDQEVGRKEGMADQYGNLGIVYQTRGDLDKAVEFYEKSLAINQELGRKEGMANQYGNLGIVYETLGKLDKAVEYWDRSLALFTEIGAAREIEQVQSLFDSVEQ